MKEIKKNIFIAGHNGMVGSSIDRAIQGLNQNKVLTKTRNELDLTIQKDVNKFFEKSNIDLRRLKESINRDIVVDSPPGIIKPSKFSKSVDSFTLNEVYPNSRRIL